MTFTLNVLVPVLCGLMVGNEFAISAFVHPPLYRLADEVHIPTGIALARVLGRYMPFWYGLCFLLLVIEAFVRRQGLLIAAASLWALAIAFTVTLLVPVNNRIAEWTGKSNAAEWIADRRLWDGRHRWRVLLLAISYILLVVAISGRF